MSVALSRAGLSPSQLWAVNAHSTSTPLGDEAECTALRRLLSQNSDPTSAWPFVTSNKGAMGHLLGAAGAAEAVFSVLSLASGIIPGAANIDSLGPKCSEGLN